MFDAFTFLFKETEHGLFQVHAYPFDEDTSTFIVECPQRTWESAGLDRMDEAQSLRFCEDLFADELRGHKLKSNKSLWLDFPRLVTKHWHDGKTVLLGDAAHTAHFTIGSGTKLAMEDAIALAAALDRHTDLGAALVDYELERKPVLERFQQAAASSADYFERVGAHAGLEPLPFAFNLLTRSGRISHANLSVRDPAFTGAGGRVVRRSGCPPPLFTPLRLGDLVLRNRVVQDTPAAASCSAVTSRSPRTAGAPRRRRSQVDGGAVVGAGGGGSADRARRPAWRDPAVHGVDVPLAAIRRGRWWPPRRSPTVRARRCRARWTRRAWRASGTPSSPRHAATGVDLLELDMAHGFLLGGFLSPLTNNRTDGYGGT